MKKTLTASVLAFAVFASSGASFAQQQAGVSAAVRGQVALARESANIVGRQVKSGEPIFLGDAITSGANSGLQVMLMDETVFTIGPNSQISIDEFVYDPSTSTGKVTASVAKGVFRFITGKIARKRPEDMTVRLPTATIGIRGTIVGGAVRTEPGADPVLDNVFNSLPSGGPNGPGDLNSFAVLLGPGSNNNTNDRGGSFTFQATVLPDGSFGPGAPGGDIDQVPLISRTNTAIGTRFGGGLTGLFEVQQNTTGQLTGLTQTNAGDQQDDEASGPGTEAKGEQPRNASNLANQRLVDGLNTALLEGGLLPPPPPPEDGSPALQQANFSELINIPMGSAFASLNGLNIGNVFNVSSGGIQFNFANNQADFFLSGITGGGLSGGSIACTSSCFFDYTNATGPAVLGLQGPGINANPLPANVAAAGVTINGTPSFSLCDNCVVSIVPNAVTPSGTSATVQATIGLIHASQNQVDVNDPNNPQGSVKVTIPPN